MRDLRIFKKAKTKRFSVTESCSRTRNTRATLFLKKDCPLDKTKNENLSALF